MSSEGDLQIVQLHRTDAGTYVCVAYNGIGSSVEREVKLTVDGMLDIFFIAFDGSVFVTSFLLTLNLDFCIFVMVCLLKNFQSFLNK